MADVQLEVDGLADLESQLLKLGGNAAPQALIKGQRSGAGVILKDARRRIRRRTGKTAKATKVVAQGVQGNESTVSITTNYVGRFLEMGTSKMPPHPFIRPAMQAKAIEAIETMREVTLAAIQLAASKR